jgi:predicted ribosome quality control (RQC) complex YloA/Tae2 family protein
MRNLTSLDIHKLLEEIAYINNGFIRNIKSSKNELYFLIYRGKEYWLKIVPGNYFCITDEKPVDTIDFGFTTILKNALKGKKADISMHNSDRILEIKTDKNTLVIEMFSKGNVILLNNGIVERALFQRSFESRVIESGKEYIYPLGGKPDFPKMYENFSEILLFSNKENLVKTLAIDFAIGGNYAEEVCFRAEVDKTKKSSELNKEEIETLKETFKEILAETQPNIINEETFSVIRLKHLEGERKYFDSINEAVKEFFEKEDEIKNGYNPIKIEVNKAKEKVGEYQKQIDYINDNYEDINKAIAVIKNSSRSIAERQEILKNLGFESKGKNLVVYAIPNLEIDITNDLRYTLSTLYNKAKRLKKVDVDKIKTNVIKVRRLKVITGNEWYSKFRFFSTSLNKLCIIGKDVNQNESLIQKHAEKGDIVGHADVFGSPFGVIKTGNAETKEVELEEMATMIASYSSAWRAGATNLDVYFVNPEQVTKTPPSGESLKKGAFYIEGKRKYIKNSSLGIYLSFDIREDSVKISVTPYQPDKPFIFLRPGNKKRDEITRKINRALSQKYGFEVNADYIDRLIPQGKSTIEKIRLL